MGILKLINKNEYFVCPNCGEHYEFSFFRVKRLIRKYGRLRCFYCQTELKKIENK